MMFSADPVWFCASRQFTGYRNNMFCFHSLCPCFDLCLKREVCVQLLISMVPCSERLLKSLNTLKLTESSWNFGNRKSKLIFSNMPMS